MVGYVLYDSDNPSLGDNAHSRSYTLPTSDIQGDIVTTITLDIGSRQGDSRNYITLELLITLAARNIY